MLPTEFTAYPLARPVPKRSRKIPAAPPRPKVLEAPKFVIRLFARRKVLRLATLVCASPEVRLRMAETLVPGLRPQGLFEHAWGHFVSTKAPVRGQYALP